MSALSRERGAFESPASCRPMRTPPIPREHGAWVMLLAPLVLGLAAAGNAPLLPSVLLASVSLSAFIAWEPAFRVLRGRPRPGDRAWTAALLSVLAAASWALLYWGPGAGLLPLAAAGLAAGVAVGALRRLGRKRLDRTVLGEVLAVSGLTLTAPAAWVVATGELDSTAWWLWAASTAFFASGVMHVKTLMRCALHKSAWTREIHRRLCGPALLYHMLLGAAVVWAATEQPKAGFWIAAAYLPVVARGLYGGVRPARRMPRLVRIGALESVYAVWFLISATIAARMVLQ